MYNYGHWQVWQLLFCSLILRLRIRKSYETYENLVNFTYCPSMHTTQILRTENLWYSKLRNKRTALCSKIFNVLLCSFLRTNLAYCTVKVFVDDFTSTVIKSPRTLANFRKWAKFRYQRLLDKEKKTSVSVSFSGLFIN